MRTEHAVYRCELEGCDTEVEAETDIYSLPDGWVSVTARQLRRLITPHSITDSRDYCCIEHAVAALRPLCRPEPENTDVIPPGVARMLNHQRGGGRPIGDGD